MFLSMAGGCGGGGGLGHPGTDAAAVGGDSGGGAMGSGGTGDGRNTGGAAGSDAGFRCTPGSDQTCNDDPAISSLWGRCNSDGVCSCGPGFAVGASGRCQLDTSCRGPGVSMTWPATVQLDTSGCAARTATDCAAGGVGAPSAILDVQLLIFAQQACHLPSHTFVMVDFVSGCPSDLRVGDSLGRADGTLVDCLSRELGQARWSCAEAVTCSLIEFATLP